MRARSALTLSLLALLSLPSHAHRLDEYLQATILSVDSGRVQVSMRLVPGVAVFPAVLALIDTDGNGSLSPSEKQAYAERVLRDLVLQADGRPLTLHLDSVSYSSLDDMKQGAGDIDLSFSADLPSAATPKKLTFHNHHQSGIAVYLVNCLVPRDSRFAIAAQSRSHSQSFYELTFAQASASPTPGSSFGISGFAGAFHLGLHHIAEGTDHLLFLLTLLLPAPLLAFAGRWRTTATIRHSLLQALRMVTAFTMGHSLTLALAGFGLLRLPSRPVEVAIAVSILVSAVHALRPLFPGWEAAIAAFFGLIHGLAFASALSGLGVTGWYRLVSIVGFNLGVEAMQLVVVAAVLPSLLLLSRTSFYRAFRITGALLATAASVSWILERSIGTANRMDPWVETVAHHGPVLGATLFVISLLLWYRRDPDRRWTISTGWRSSAGSET